MIDDKYGHLICDDVMDALPPLASGSIQSCITSPPYFGLRDYGNDKQIGMEKTPQEYVEKMVEVFREVKRVLRDDGTFWLNIGDSYANDAKWGGSSGGKHVKGLHGASGVGRGKRLTGLKSKDLIGIPWMLAFALRADGWYLRQDIIWHKPNPMPGSMSDRCTTAHEYVFLLTKSPRYFCDMEAIKEPATYAGTTGCMSGKKNSARSAARGGKPSGNERPDAGRIPVGDDRNKRSVWIIPTKGFKGAHFAVMPEALVTLCMKAGTSQKGCCSKCGAPVTRIVEKERVATRPGDDTKVTGTSAVHGNRDPERHVTETRTVGWGPSCRCIKQKIVPCTVLDPFSGAGTVATVAVKGGRRFVGIELNPEYAALSEARINKAIRNRGFGFL